MPDSDDTRRNELIAAAITGDLTPAETAELDALRLDDPSIDIEILELGQLVEALSGDAGVGWDDIEPSKDLAARVAAIGSPAGAETVVPHGTPATAAVAHVPGRRPRRPASTRSRRGGWLLLAAACLVVGGAVGSTLPGLLDRPPVGPPGTLGAFEVVELEGVPAGASIEADVVAHTWGLEAILDAEGLTPGATYTVVMISESGEEFSAGEMLGSTVPIHCRLNAAVLREDVQRLEVRDVGGEFVATAELPDV